MPVTGTVRDNKVVRQESVTPYRSLSGLNYSMIKLWDENPIVFFDQFKQGHIKNVKKSQSLIIGDIAHFHCLDSEGRDDLFEQKMDEKFAIYQGVKGSGQVFSLCDHLFDATKESLNEKGFITESFANRFQTAFDLVVKEGKYKGKKVEQALEDFNKNGEPYFRSLMENIGKTVVTDMEIEVAKRASKRLRNDVNTAHIFEGDIQVSYPIEWEYVTKSGQVVQAKCEIDLIKFDHQAKTIQPFDPKFTWDNEEFHRNYLSYRYYLQQAYYVLSLIHHFSEDERFHDYTILPMQYIAGDTSVNNRRPLIYPCLQADLKAGLEGFYHNKIYYKGIHQLIEEIMWAEETGNWDIKKEAFENDGVVYLDFDYHNKVVHLSE